jgi:3-mercaptopyruvate sulfurtransferase SseA
MKCILLMIMLTMAAADAKKDEKPAPAPATRPAARKDVGVEEFEKLWKEKKGVVLDVRTAKEFSEGHIPGGGEYRCQQRGF